jgi:small subunit ribosomal protein S9
MSEKVVVATGKRKTAVARAVAHKGTGKVFVNKIPVELIKPDIARLKVSEPIEIAGRDVANGIDVKITVEGGGVMGQAEASRVVVSNVLASFGGESVRKRLLEYDRKMLVGDSRRTEPKKFGGHSARRRKQKSYR